MARPVLWSAYGASLAPLPAAPSAGRAAFAGWPLTPLTPRTNPQHHHRFSSLAQTSSTITQASISI